jgi:hypothetical protein
LLLLLLQRTHLALLPKDTLFCLKLLTTQLTKLPTHLTSEAVGTRGLLQTLKPGPDTLQSEARALHTRLSALHTHTVELACLLQTLQPRLLTSHSAVDTRQTELATLQDIPQPLLRTGQTLQAQTRPELLLPACIREGGLKALCLNPRLQASQIRSRLTLLDTKSRAAERSLLGELSTDRLPGNI